MSKAEYLSFAGSIMAPPGCSFGVHTISLTWQLSKEPDSDCLTMDISDLRKAI